MVNPLRAAVPVLLSVSLASVCAFGAGGRSAVPHENLPRKVIVGTVCRPFRGALEKRVELIGKAVDDIAALKKKRYGDRRLDLLLLPEHCMVKPAKTAAERAVPMAYVKEVIGGAAKKLGSYVAAGVLLTETIAGKDHHRNALVLFDRGGKLAGVYRKVHAACNWDDPDTVLSEAGVSPGSGFPVFETDFGKVGFLVCWDMSYSDGWAELKRNGAEIVGVSTLSPQVFRPSMFAHEHEYWVMTASPGHQAAVISPIGFPLELVKGGEIIVTEIDLSFVTLHWSATLKGGRKFADTFGPGAYGGIYRPEENNGVFWSNLPDKTVGQMIREMNIRPRTDEEIRSEKVSARNRVPATGVFK